MQQQLSASKKIYLKFLLKFFRITGIKKYFPIQAGVLKGILFNVYADNDIFYGNYEKDAVQKIITLAQKNKESTFVDVGAHYGFYSILFFRINIKNIFAFEPDASNYRILLKTFELNKLQVHTFNCAVSGDGEYEVAFSKTKMSASNTYIHSNMLGENIIREIIPAFSIDELMRKKKISSPAFIKLDVEGAEYLVLQGALNTIEKHQPYFLLATHDCHLPGVRDNCVNLLNSLGYHLEALTDVKAFPGLDDFFCTPPSAVLTQPISNAI
ncbi:MAG: FkbM family methyltransferase [Ferruginibacter sp.]